MIFFSGPPILDLQNCKGPLFCIRPPPLQVFLNGPQCGHLGLLQWKYRFSFQAVFIPVLTQVIEKDDWMTIPSEDEDHRSMMASRLMTCPLLAYRWMTATRLDWMDGRSVMTLVLCDLLILVCSTQVWLEEERKWSNDFTDISIKKSGCDDSE